MSSTVLFTIPIPACDPHPAGSVVATEPSSQVYLLTFSCAPDNRLTTAMCQALLKALEQPHGGIDDEALGAANAEIGVEEYNCALVLILILH